MLALLVTRWMRVVKFPVPRSGPARDGGHMPIALHGRAPLAILALVVAIGCGTSTTTAPQLVAQTTADTIAIVGVNLIPMDRDGVVAGQTLLVAEGRIVAIGDANTFVVPKSATTIDGTGRYALPGLIDMHVHARTPDLPAYVSAGITSARNMWGTSFLRGSTHIGAAIVPTAMSPALYSASPGVDGHPASWPETRFLEDPTDADTLVANLVSEGWLFIKAYNRLSLAAYDALVAAARAHGIRVVGHVPFAVPIDHALESQTSIEHLTGYDRALSGGVRGALAWADADTTGGDRLAAITRQHDVWNCPTLSVLANLTASVDDATRSRATRGREAFIRQLHRAGARLLAGTDAGIGLTSPGTSLHDELELFVKAGLTPYEALSAATKDAAEFLQQESEIGTLAAGRRADIVLLGANPLDDIRNSRRVDGVILRGAWYRASSATR
jgi:imidazolonepropionase-like amidohydrolase